jgi:hypothetical protein
VTDELPRVAASESDLVVLARALIASNPTEACSMMYRTRALPPAISVACEELLGDALAQVWPALWRRGGIEPAASASGGGEIRRGRMWQRRAPEGLGFSVATLRLLRWLLATPLAVSSATPRTVLQVSDDRAPVAMTVGDQVMVYLALDAATGTPAQAAIAAQPLVRAAPLAWLGFADLFGTAPVPSLDGLCAGAGALVVEALAGELARRWRAVELSKRAIAVPEVLIAIGAAQDAVLGGFMAACDRHGRRDLAVFVIDAAAPLVARGIAPVPARLQATATLARRAAARVAAGALLRGVTRWAVWDQAHRGVRFLDDDYAATQLLLARFEAIQAAGAARAAAWLADLASLAPTTVAPSAATVDGP